MAAINAVYYPSWRVYKDLPPSSLQAQEVTHVLYAFVRVNEDGTLRLLDEYADMQIDVDGEKGCLAALARLKTQHPHIKTILSVGGGDGCAEFPVMAAAARSRETFAWAAREFVDRHALDGIDIDWESPSSPEEGTNYLILLQTLRAHLPAPRYLLTTALPVAKSCLQHINLFAASHVLDYLNLMGYDFSGPWTEVAGHQAALLPPKEVDVFPTLRANCHVGVDWLIQHGFPRRKIVLGVPAYARYFPGARAAGHPFRKDDCGEMDYCDMPQDWLSRAVIDDERVTAHVVDAEKGLVSFDMPETVRLKAGYVKAMGLAGLFYWTGVGDGRGNDSLVTAGRQGLDEL